MSEVPEVQGMTLFEQYEKDGNLLVVTSDASALKLEPGDRIVKRPWATAAPAEPFNDAAQSLPDYLTPPEFPSIRSHEEQRQIDQTPCPKCGGDRLRPNFAGGSACHAGGQR